MIRARLWGYRYRGPHAVRNGRPHWDWAYEIRVNGLRVYWRTGFHTWPAARASLARAWPRVVRAVSTGGQPGDDTPNPVDTPRDPVVTG